MLDQYLENKQLFNELGLPSSKYLKILETIKNAPSSINEIKNEFKKNKIDFSKTTVKKDVDKLEEFKFIGYISKRKRPKHYKLVLKYAYNKKWASKTNKYYFYTPRSFKLYSELNKIINNLVNKKRANELLNETLIIFRAIELMAKFEKEYNFNNKVIKNHYKYYKKINLTNQDIENKKQKRLQQILKFSKSKKRFKIDGLQNRTIKIKNKSYIKINDELFPFESINKFIEIFKENMSIMMDWITFNCPENQNNLGLPLFVKAIDLFFEIKKSSQIGFSLE